MFTDTTALTIQLSRIERKLDVVMEHLGIVDDRTTAIRDEVRQVKETVGVISAVKRYRELTGASLVEAKLYVETL
ncbi:hypothetical protein [Acidipropionibacterium timonense]|uniref:hypothetical protein n=1 Tax=Acidipropionibacterium timonense TaxID=2161818 RepID=UPI001031D82E|nr:hypothetical protein [Acidipropionibacterium timonense]